MLEFSDEVIANHIGVISGFAFASEYFSSENGIPLIRIRNLLQHKTETFYRASFDIDYMVNNGDILIGMDGDFNVVRWRGEPGLLNQRICKVSSKSELLNEGYLFHWLQPRIDEIHRKTPQTTVRHLSTKDIEHISIPFFPLNEQRRITEILDTIDEAIQRTEALISKLKAMKQGLLEDLLTRGLDKNGKLRDPKAHPEQFKDSPLGRIPKEWLISRVDELLREDVLVEVQDGNHGELHPKTSDFVSDGVPFLMAKDLQGGKIDFEACYKITYRQYRSLRVGFSEPSDVLLTHKGTIGLTAIVPDTYPQVMLTPQVTLYRMGATKRLLPDYLFWYFQSSMFQQRLKILSTQSTRAYIGIRLQGALDIVLPTLREQKLIVDVLDSHDTCIRTEERYSDKLKLQKKGLMHDLLTGKMRVKT